MQRIQMFFFSVHRVEYYVARKFDVVWEIDAVQVKIGEVKIFSKKKRSVFKRKC